jgi:hypothetical protein
MAIVIVFAALGLFFVYKAIQLIRLGGQSKSWKPGRAVVKGARHMTEIGPAERSRKFTHVMVVYEYEYGGRTYQGDRVRFKWNRHRIQDELDRFQPGSEHVVYVNPDDPGQAVLEPGTDITNYMALLAGAFFVVAGIVVMLIE